MADISIKQSHQLSENNAKAVAQKMADKVVAEYDMTASWNGNILSFKSSGASGTLVLHEKEAQIDVTLGFLLKMFSARIEEKVAQQMRKMFAEKA
ncbi:MAG: polyhydroxyalkanoic acid system protein [Burkholderiales bacterium RIFCSPLOWO2_02_FULL_57_36]|nr:MAG: polyhydroxyalkanoic acid system protein [Burkholderiales bacterium RIFCSPLOWO2_02_FULL_57_36]